MLEEFKCRRGPNFQPIFWGRDAAVSGPRCYNVTTSDRRDSPDQNTQLISTGSPTPGPNPGRNSDFAQCPEPQASSTRNPQGIVSMSIIFEKREQIAYITISNPDKANILDKASSDAISEAWKEVWEDRNIRAAVLTGDGDKYFCAGHNL
ncbi:MAG: hypothetical protein CL724_03370, partial [Chloroflexi bacterium]|nr:hypothetical protein [Chloroflexota bacterium]